MSVFNILNAGLQQDNQVAQSTMEQHVIVQMISGPVVQYRGQTCGIKYIYDVEKGPGLSSNTTIKDAIYFYPLGSPSTSTSTTRTATKTSTSVSTGTTFTGQCVQNKNKIAGLQQVLGVNTPSDSLDFDYCASYCKFNKFKYVGIQYAEKHAQGGQTTSSISYVGSFCYCANDLGDTSNYVAVGFGSQQPGYCGDCNTGIGSNPVSENPSQFHGRTCGIQSLYSGPGCPAATCIDKDSLYFYSVDGVTPPTSTTSITTTSSVPTRTATSTPTATSTTAAATYTSTTLGAGQCVQNKSMV
ncbi:hypothetical protein HDU76_011944, partial [Blyttiomyces sp. JEL0837]